MNYILNKNAFVLRFHVRYYTKSYSNTVLLPKTLFPLRLSKEKLIERDKVINDLAASDNLYKWQKENNNGPEFILHDGPPYANGSLHMGHAMNKILKDAILRRKVLQGFKVQYIPGWDCHGLPIELKVLKNSDEEMSPIEIRKKARNFAMEAVDLQKKMFKSWGVLGDWDNSYLTCSNDYIKNKMWHFYKMFKMGLIYRDVKPVYWSPSSRSALAESELEYKENHISKSITLRLEIDHFPLDFQRNNEKIYGLIWTTTPWTLPSNQAVAFNSKIMYNLIQKLDSEDTNYYILAEERLETLSKNLKSDFKVISRFLGEKLNGTTYRHPMHKETLQNFLPGSFATGTKGTGLVHVAPAHGPDDFLLSLEHKIPIVSLVDKNGCYKPQAGEDLKDLPVLSTGGETVLSKLVEDVMFQEDFTHSYPYDWRTKQPVIIVASKQWFIDTNSIKTEALEHLKGVSIFPSLHQDNYRRILNSQLTKRPYWCISRQRCWGTPIPVFYNKNTGEPIINSAIIKHLCDLIDTNGSDYWWTLPLERLLPQEVLKNSKIDLNNIDKGKDILDIWFDSGLCWSQSGYKVSDLYLEGVDQFGGWFQSSLMTSVALKKQAPFKSLYVHGFAVDKKGLKMSKSLGNVINPEDIMRGCKGGKIYGVDTLRWWVVCHANSDPKTNVSETVLQAAAEEVQKVRSVLRFALATLNDYNNEEIEYDSLPLIDKYMLHCLWIFGNEVNHLQDSYNFNKLSSFILNFLTNSVSALYYTAIKDRLYCNPENETTRRAAQYTVNHLLQTILKGIAPIVPHLAEEFHSYLPEKSTDLFFQTTGTSVSPKWENQIVWKLFQDVVLNIRQNINKVSDGNTLDLKIRIAFTPVLLEEFKAVTNLSDFGNELCDILQVSQVELVPNSDLNDFYCETGPSDLFVCNRCRRVSSQSKNELCKRCATVVEDNYSKTVIAN